MSSFFRFALIAWLALFAAWSADTIRTRGTVVYRIKVLMPDGRVRIFQIPA
jgi:hypothetical protein